MAEWIWIDPAWDLSVIDPEGIAIFRPAFGGYGLEMLNGSEIPKAGVETAMRAFAPVTATPIWPIAVGVTLAGGLIGLTYWLAKRQPKRVINIRFVKRKK